MSEDAQARSRSRSLLVILLGILLALIGLVLAVGGAWLAWLGGSIYYLLAGVGLIGSLGQWAITEAFKRGEASFIAPLEYTALIWGVALDWSIWRTLPAPITWLGAAVIIASGIFLIRRERVHVEAEHP